MAHRLAPQAVEDLDGIWSYAATESGSVETANRLIDSITGRFFLLAHYPYMGRVRDEDFGSGARSSLWVSTSSSTALGKQTY